MHIEDQLPLILLTEEQLLLLIIEVQCQAELLAQATTEAVHRLLEHIHHPEVLQAA